MTLTTDQIEQITVDLLIDAPPRVTGKEADVFRDTLSKEIAWAQERGYTIEVPFELPELDAPSPKKKSKKGTDK